jgi:hypothetical protein
MIAAPIILRCGKRSRRINATTAIHGLTFHNSLFEWIFSKVR